MKVFYQYEDNILKLYPQISAFVYLEFTKNENKQSAN